MEEPVVRVASRSLGPIEGGMLWRSDFASFQGYTLGDLSVEGVKQWAAGQPYGHSTATFLFVVPCGEVQVLTFRMTVDRGAGPRPWSRDYRFLC